MEMIIGVLFVIAACFCWGFIFVVPKFLAGFSPIEIALGRYLFFGVASLALMLTAKRHLFHKSYAAIWIKSIWLSFISTLLSYTCVVFSIHYANSAATTLIFGMSPITIALYGNWSRKEYSFKGFLFPGLLMALGIVLVNLDAFHFEGVSIGQYCLGLFCGFAGLGTWTWYAVANFTFKEQNKQIPVNDWVTMMGVSTLILTVFATGLFAWVSPDLHNYSSMTTELQTFLIGSLILGVVSTWIAFVCWNCGNARLPVSLAGQLTVFEMIFGLLFIYIAEQRLPFPLEITGIAIMLIGVLTAFKTLRIGSEEPSSSF